MMVARLHSTTTWLGKLGKAETSLCLKAPNTHLKRRSQLEEHPCW